MRTTCALALACAVAITACQRTKEFSAARSATGLDVSCIAGMDAGPFLAP